MILTDTSVLIDFFYDTIAVNELVSPSHCERM